MIKRERFQVSTGIYRYPTEAEQEASRGPDGKRQVWEGTKIKVGTIEVEVEVEVDMLGLANELGRRALKSKAGRAVEAGGLVKVKVIKKLRRETKKTT
jgi:hypothetical protein